MKKPIIRQLLVALIATVLAYLLGLITNRIPRIFGLGLILSNTLGILLKCIPAMFLSYIIVEKLICKEKQENGADVLRESETGTKRKAKGIKLGLLRAVLFCLPIIPPESIQIY